MQQAQLSAPASKTPETAEAPGLYSLPAPAPVHPVELTAKLAGIICDIVRLEGISDAAAGALAGVSRARLARWKAEDEVFAMALCQARARFELELVREIRNARKRDGSRDWRAQVWLLQHLSAEGEGYTKAARPSRSSRGKGEAAADQNGAILPETAEIAETQSARPAAGSRETTAKLPETPATASGGVHPPIPSARPKTPTPSPAAPMQNAPFVPETPPTQRAAGAL